MPALLNISKKENNMKSVFGWFIRNPNVTAIPIVIAYVFVGMWNALVVGNLLPMMASMIYLPVACLGLLGSAVFLRKRAVVPVIQWLTFNGFSLGILMVTLVASCFTFAFKGEVQTVESPTGVVILEGGESLWFLPNKATKITVWSEKLDYSEIMRVQLHQESVLADVTFSVSPKPETLGELSTNIGAVNYNEFVLAEIEESVNMALEGYVAGHLPDSLIINLAPSDSGLLKYFDLNGYITVTNLRWLNP